MATAAQVHPVGVRPQTGLVLDLFPASTTAPISAAEGRAWGPRPERVLVVGFDLLAAGTVMAALLGPGLAVAPAVLPAVAFLVLLPLLGLDRPGFEVSVVEEVPRLAAAFAIVTVGSAAIISGTALGALGSAVRVTGPLLMLLLVGRVLSHAMVRFLRRRRLVVHRTLIVGADPVARHLAAVFDERPELGCLPVGWVDGPVDVGDGPPAAGDAVSLDGAAERLLADRVIVGFGAFEPDDVVRAARLAGIRGVEFWAVPRAFELSRTARREDVVDGVALLRLSDGRSARTARALKVLMDVVVSLVLLLLVSPFLLVFAAISRKVDGPGVIVRDRVVGSGGQPLTLLRLRTTRPPRDDIEEDETVPWWGRLMRRLSIDEVPQLWNVLRGDLSLVGPSPDAPHVAERFAAEVGHYRWRQRVTSGLTGLAQVSGLRGDGAMAERARLDNHYIEHWSLWLDVMILLRTPWAVLRRRRRFDSEVCAG